MIVELGALDLLGIVFIISKLCGVITWSWWLVIAPIWIPAAIVFVSFILIIVIDKLNK